jgi:large subunit ribosomal protein L10
MATQKKIATVTTLTEKVKRAKSIVFAQYKGIKHKQLEELRKKLKAAGSEIVVSKNRLLLRSLGGAGDRVKDILEGDTAALFSYTDEVAGVKVLTRFFKDINLGKTKGGLLGEKVLTNDDVMQLAALPGREILLGKLVGQMSAPLYNLHHALSWNIHTLVWGLNALREKKS